MKPITTASLLITAALLVITAACVLHRNNKATPSRLPSKPAEEIPADNQKPVPEKALANCEIRGFIKLSGEDRPVENIMVFAMYSVDKTMKSNKITEVVGPLLTDANGKFTVPAFWMDKTYFENYQFGGCTGVLIFIHPKLGAFGTSICRDEYPPDVPFKTLELIQYQNGEHLRNNNIKASYEEINQLPPEQRKAAWNHVDQSFRPDSEIK